MQLSTRLWFLVPAAIALGLAMTNVALASSHSVVATRLTLSAPPQAPLGDPIQLEARLEDDAGRPIGEATLRFYSPASFLSGASGLMPIGQAVTNDRGVAVTDFVSRRNGQVEVMVEYQGDSRYAPSQAAARIMVEGNHQLYEAEAGLRVPFINKWLLVGILSAIWGTFLFVVLLVLRIALAPSE